MREDEPLHGEETRHMGVTDRITSRASSTPVTHSFHGVRWWIIALIFAAVLINFLNRLTVAVLGTVISAQFHLSSAQFASLTTMFLLAYTISQGLSGKLYDAVGVKAGFTISVILWSALSMAHALARGLISLDIFRFFLGLGEGGIFPGMAKVVAEWFPVRERALAIGICSGSTAIGTVIATPLMIWMNFRFGWRMTFVLLGTLGLVWLIVWLRFYAPPASNPYLSSGEYDMIVQGRTPQREMRSLGWRELMAHREMWAIIFARFFGDPIWWFYITWLPMYLFKIRHFSLQQIGMFGWMPFLAADIGSLFGGWLAGHLMRRGWTLDAARKTGMGVGTVLMCSGIFAARTASPLSALTLIALVLFGFQCWVSNVHSLPSDYFPENAVGTAMGMGGVGAGIGSMLLTQATGFAIDRYSYGPVLLVAGLLPIAAIMSALFFGKTIRPVSL